MIIPIVVLVTLTALLIGLVRSSSKGVVGHSSFDRDAVWGAALAGEDSQVGRMLMSVAKPLAAVTEVREDSNVYRSLHTKLAAAGGGLYAGSVEVFLSVQVAAILISGGLLAISPLFKLQGVAMYAAIAFAFALAYLPYNRVADAGKKRLSAVREQLPEFAELLLMPVTSGYGIIPALDFTASRLEGVVADEVRSMLGLLSSRAGTEQDIFALTGERLADPAAVTFFHTLFQSYTDGVKVSDSLRAQATALRASEHQRKRATIKKLPNKMVFIIAGHLLPFLFVVTVLPTLYAMGNM